VTVSSHSRAMRSEDMPSHASVHYEKNSRNVLCDDRIVKGRRAKASNVVWSYLRWQSLAINTILKAPSLVIGVSLHQFMDIPHLRALSLALSRYYCTLRFLSMGENVPRPHLIRRRCFPSLNRTVTAVISPYPSEYLINVSHPRAVQRW